MRKSIITLAVILGGAVALPGCSTAELTGQKCIVLANGGNKLCGNDAKAWCESTDSIRSGAQDLQNEYGDGSIDTSISESQSLCDDIRGQ